ncbi:MAG: hypothetical protein M9942_00100 [Microthrixaceae bacterium]|nr:hypothetical protein [Microthrixaceae bacterium]
MGSTPIASTNGEGPPMWWAFVHSAAIDRLSRARRAGTVAGRAGVVAGRACVVAGRAGAGSRLAQGGTRTVDRRHIRAEVGGHHCRVVEYVRGCALDDHLAQFHGDQPVTEARQQGHVVFDHEHAHAGLVADLAQQWAEGLGLALRHSGRRLVEAHHEWFLGEQAGELHDPAGTGRQGRGRGVRVGLQSEHLDQCRHLLGGGILRHVGSGLACGVGDE